MAHYIRASRWLVAIASAAGCLFAQGNALSWRLTNVDSTGGRFPSLAIGLTGRPVIAYQSNGLRLAELVGSSWTMTPLDLQNQTGRQTSLAFNTFGRPGVAYEADSQGTVLRVMQFMWDGCTPSWGGTTVVRSEGPDAPTQTLRPSIAFGPAFWPVVSYYWYNPARGTGELRFARVDGFRTIITTIDDASGSSSLAYPANQPAAVAYPSSSGLRFGQLVGTAWNTGTVDAAGDSPSLAYGRDGQPAVAYRASGSLRFARFNGSAWSIVTVDAIGESPSMAFDRDGRPAIAYLANGAVRFARLDAGGWNSTAVDAAGGETPCLAFATDGYPIIAYARAGIRFAQASEAAPLINSPPQPQTAIAGGQTTLTVNATGLNLSYQWRLNGADIPGATNATHAIPSAQSFHSGTYTVVVSNTGGSVTSQPATVTVNAPTPSAARLTNISNRAFCGVGSQALICGFVVSNEGPKTLLIRVVGPTLASAFGVTGVLTDPILRLYRHEGAAENLLFSNDDWSADTGADRTTTAAVTAQVGAFALPVASKDAALVATLRPGVYTVQATGAGGGTGMALVEVYEVP